MSEGEHLVGDYLTRLERAAAVLPAERRLELLEEISGHIAAAQPVDEAAVRTLLDRLGEPEEIVAVAREDLPGAAAPGAAPGWAPQAVVPRGTGHELAAVLMLTAGSLLPVVGWLVGVVLLWTSSLWRVREKVLGTLVVPLGPGGVLLLGAFLPWGYGNQVCTSGGTLSTGVGSTPEAPLQPAPPPPFAEDGSVTCTSEVAALPGGTALLLVVLVAPLVVAVVLMSLARRRAQEQSATVPLPAPSSSPWGGLEIAGVLLLGLGGLVVPFVGTLVGLGLCCASPRWARGHKSVAAALVAAPLLLVAVAFLPGLTIPALAPGLGIAFLLAPLGGLLAACYLAVALQRRP